ncbi:PAS domain-containing protein [Desulfobulbus alkaliphilus]|uniref:PAS domain-containing protein n=1 Tax=Desulfobulbus alkaliphilus TaxID=869814 RepID=UPI001F05A7CE|nr:PAS domain-containing protein [Desulfobulbus alkaliphilus]
MTTVNAELQNKIQELSGANNDLNTLLAGLGIATILVDHQLRIQRFTPAATRIINLIAGDIGRPVGHIVSNLVNYENLVADTQAVLDTLRPIEKEVQATDGTWNQLRIWPYRTTENIIEGAVITFVECTEIKKTQDALRLNEERMRVALQTVPIVIANQDKALRYTWICNEAPFPASRILGKTDADLLPPDEAAELMAIKQRVLESGTGVRQKVRITFDGTSQDYDLLAEPLRDTEGTSIGITCAMVARPGYWPGNQPDNEANK